MMIMKVVPTITVIITITNQWHVAVMSTRLVVGRQNDGLMTRFCCQANYDSTLVIFTKVTLGKIYLYNMEASASVIN